MDYIGPDYGAQDFDVLLMVEYKNMAAFDGLREKADPVADKYSASLPAVAGASSSQYMALRPGGDVDD